MKEIDEKIKNGQITPNIYPPNPDKKLNLFINFDKNFINSDKSDFIENLSKNGKDTKYGSF